MEFGVVLCAVIQVQRSKVKNSTLQLSETMSLRSLLEVETLKYLGMSESSGMVDGHKAIGEGAFILPPDKIT